MGVVTETGVVVWRVPPLMRFGIAFAHVVFVLLFLFAGVLERDVKPLVFGGVLVVLSVLNILMVFRRGARLEADRLVLRGRVATRIVELADLKQVALTPSQYGWVQTHHPVDRHGTTVLRLGMMWSVFGANGPRPREVVPIMRKRAMAAGATLDPQPPRGTRAPFVWRGLFFGR